MIVITDAEFESLIEFVKVNYGINLTARKSFVEMRMLKLMNETGYTNFSDYFNFVCCDVSGIAISNFISALTINYTMFNRESYHFDYLTSDVLPQIVKAEQYTKDLRIWSAGCATGEEPYTLAMVVADFLGESKSAWDMKILATDISSFALKKAVEAVYPIDSIESLNPSWVGKYFTTIPDDNESIKVAPVIRDEVIFRKFNLIGDAFNFKKKFHFIFCRNVMIYFDEPTKNKLISKYYDSLVDGGYLFIGMSETMSRENSKFKYCIPSVFRKEEDAK